MTSDIKFRIRSVLKLVLLCALLILLSKLVQAQDIPEELLDRDVILSRDSNPLPPTILLGPPNDSIFNAQDQVKLSWQPIKETLADNEYYLIIIRFMHQGRLWTDYAWTKDSSWRLNEHKYLFGISDNGRFKWSVILLQEVDRNADNVPIGVALSQQSSSHITYWRSDVSSDDLTVQAPPTPSRPCIPNPYGCRDPFAEDQQLIQILAMAGIMGGGLMLAALFLTDPSRYLYRREQDENALHYSSIS